MIQDNSDRDKRHMRISRILCASIFASIIEKKLESQMLKCYYYHSATRMRRRIMREAYSQQIASISFPPLFPGDPLLELVSLHVIDYNANHGNWAYLRSYAHRHSFMEIHYMLKGKQTYQFGDQFLDLVPNSLLIVPEQCLHALPYHSSEMSKYCVCLSIKGEPLSAVWQVLNIHHPVCVRDERILGIFKLLLACSQEKKADWYESLHCLVRLLLITIANDIDTDLPVIVSGDIPQYTESEQRVLEAERYIRDNLNAPMNCENIAQAQHISVKQLNRNVQKERGMTLRELIRNTKTQEACHLLRNTNERIKTISKVLAFSDESSFNRFFHEAVGTSPSEYRKKNKCE